MDRRKYYVTVGTGEIVEDQSAPNVAQSYEFEIEATEEEVNELRYLFERSHEFEGATLFAAVTPYIGYHDDEENHQYDESLKDIYRMIHRLGSSGSKQHIESMEIL